MGLIAVGLSHKTAPVGEREQLSVSTKDLPELLRIFQAEYGSGVILSTCNRTEVYVHSRNSHNEIPSSELLRHVADYKGYDQAMPLPNAYEFEEGDVARHLFRVAAGVDSMVLGESEILGQVRSAFSAANKAKSLDAVLSRLFHEAIRTGKQARTDTEISRHAVSVSSAAVNLAKKHMVRLDNAQTLVVGAGSAGKLAARALRDAGAHRVCVTNRTSSRAEELAAYLGGETLPFSELESALKTTDLVITCSSAPEFLINEPMISHALTSRLSPLIILDLAVPRDVDPLIKELRNVKLFDIDDLQAESNSSLRKRESSIDEVISIVEENGNRFDDWLLGRRSAPIIRALVERTDLIRNTEITRTARDLDLPPHIVNKLESMTTSIVKKIMHDPITFLKYSDDPEKAAGIIRNVFDIEDD